MQQGTSEVKLRERLAGGAQNGGDVEALVRQLIERVGEEPAPGSPLQGDKSTQEVVLDMRVDGMRYMLTRSHSPRSEPKVNLSPRETEIIRLVAKGHPNKTIAAVLEISPWTVATHLRRVYSKLGVNCRAEMVARVLNDGLLGSNES